MKKKLLIVFTILIVNILIGLNIYNNSKIPDLRVTHNNESIEIIKCPYSWNTFLKHELKDYPTPYELGKSLVGTKLEPNAMLTLKFNKDTEHLDISLWSDKGVKLQTPSNYFAAPIEKGIYIYRVVGSWKQCEVGYIFKVVIK